MELISQHAKKIMEGCKERARDYGLTFQDESLEYIVTNRDLLELSPKTMIPTLYDYWVQDVEVLREQGRYELYPSNPYETVINTRPPISFYNDNNPDWLNVMIFYHVLGHIDFFQNNLFFRHTWDYNFSARALADKRLIAKLRSDKGRWVDYVIEFAKSADNLVGYFKLLSSYNKTTRSSPEKLLDYYFDIFLQQEKKISLTEYIKEIERYNTCQDEHGASGENYFLDSIKTSHREIESLFKKYKEKKSNTNDSDVLLFLMKHSKFLNKEENRWMLPVIEVIRSTSLYFQPQIRTKILNEGWASYWHEKLFLQDDRINGHEVDFSIVNAKVTSMPRVGLNPYALGMRLFQDLEERANRGKRSMEYMLTKDSQLRDKFDTKSMTGKDFIFSVRENFSDSMFVNTFIDQEFVDHHKLFVVGKRLNEEKMTWQYYIKSKKAEAYRDMVADSLYHPPTTLVNVDKNNTLVLNHIFENKPLVRDFIEGTLMGLEFLWGDKVCLYTSEPIPVKKKVSDTPTPEKYKWRRFRYSVHNKRVSRELVE